MNIIDLCPFFCKIREQRNAKYDIVGKDRFKIYGRFSTLRTLVELWTRTFYLSFFTILIPLGAYTIHNGSSAVAAMVSYLGLSFFIPFLYLGSSKSGFGTPQRRIKRLYYVLAWILGQFITYQLFVYIEPSFIWELPSVGRDIVFVIIMYVQVGLILTASYGLTKMLEGKRR